MQRNSVFFVCCYSFQSDRYLLILFNFKDELCVWIVVFFSCLFVLFCFVFLVFISVIVLYRRNRLLHRKCAVRIFIHESQNFRNERVSVANE